MPTAKEMEEHLKAKASGNGGGRKAGPPQEAATSPDYSGGYSLLPNHLLEGIMRERFKASELKIILWVFRNTYGRYPHKFVKYNAERIAEKTGYSRKQIDRAFTSLKPRNVLNFKEGDGQKKLIQVNLSTRTWTE